MNYPRPSLRLSLCLATLVAVFCAPPAALALGDDWRPIEASELALKSPVVEPDADAEVLFWDVRIDDDQADLVFKHYVRIKVFTDRGRESQSKVDIPYLTKFVQIKDVAGRTIKADGSILELKKSDIFERDIVKANGLKLKAKSFAMPGIEAGAIIEYRWREVRPGAMVRYQRLHFQRDIPMQRVTYHVKPLQSPYFPFAMRYQQFRTQAGSKFEKEKEGFFAFTQTNVPAFREEPHMPPEDQVRSWMLVYYSPDTNLEPAKYWKDYGRRVHELFKGRVKGGDDVKKAAAEIVGDAATPEQKLERIYEFCRTKIQNVSDDASGMSAAEIEKAKENKSASDTLKRGVGNGGDIDMLFGALASAVGFDVRVAMAADRGDIFFDATFADDYFINPASIAVRVGEGWRFFNPGYGYLPFGMLRWQEEGTATLVTDPKEPTFVLPPVSAPEKSLQKRIARLKLSEDGTLEGDVRLEYTGHYAVEMKEYNDDDSPAEREETLKGRIKSRLPGAEISNIRVENVTDYAKPFAYQFHVRVPGYAQRTGKRLFIRPAFFQFGLDPLFPTSARRHAVYFHYPWSEDDSVEIGLPEGFALDNAEAPTPYGADAISTYKPTLAVTKDGRTLVYKRQFTFNSRTAEGSPMILPAGGYSRVKAFFDEIHKQDSHTVSIKQGAAATPTATSDAAKP
ncbi:MAG TPA: DUF3857 domain-containing protein [Pyrinomonadaceae bacterium]